MSLAVLLRKVKLLASRLGVGAIGEWAERELSGYDGHRGAAIFIEVHFPHGLLATIAGPPA